MHPVWLWFQQARKEAKDPEFDAITDTVTEQELVEAHEFLQGIGRPEIFMKIFSFISQP